MTHKNQTSDWKRISEEPPSSKDKVLLCVANAYGHEHVKTGFITKSGDVFSMFDDGDCLGSLLEQYATHWMPLPKLPEGF